MTELLSCWVVDRVVESPERESTWCVKPCVGTLQSASLQLLKNVFILKAFYYCSPLKYQLIVGSNSCMSLFVSFILFVYSQLTVIVIQPPSFHVQWNLIIRRPLCKSFCRHISGSAIYMNIDLEAHMTWKGLFCRSKLFPYPFAYKTMAIGFRFVFTEMAKAV